MAELSLDQAIPRFKANENRMDIFTNGSDTTSMTTSAGETVPSLRKFIKDKDTQINTSAGSILSQSQAAQTAAADSATAAAASATTANTKATAASGSATAAAGSATAAAGSATSASTSATNAANSATAAAAAVAPLNFVTRAAAIAATIPASLNIIYVGGYTANGDGGGAQYRRVGSQPTHSGKLQSADGAWWEIQPDAKDPRQYGSVVNNAADASNGIVAALTRANGVILPYGTLTVGTGLVIDNSALTGEIETGAQSKILAGIDARQSILKATSGLATEVLKVLYGTDAAAHSYNHFEKFSVIGNGNNNGMRLKNGAFLRMSDVVIKGSNIGLTLESVLSSSFRDVRFDWNTYGVSAIKGTGPFYPNAIEFSSCVFSNNLNLGYSGGDAHHNVSFNYGSVEGNGVQGSSTTGGIFLNFNGGIEGAVGATFRNVYFEGNAGYSDIRLENLGAGRVTVIVEGCNFNRISASKYTRANITASGNINLILIGNSFRSMNDYVEDASRPYIDCSPEVRVTQIGNYYASPVAAAGYMASGNSLKSRGSVDANGNPVSLPAGWSVTKAGTGIYTVQHNANFPPSNYAALAVANGSGQNLVQRVVKSDQFFQVVTQAISGALADTPFDFICLFD